MKITNGSDAFEIWESEDGSARFTFSHSDENMTTGILTLKPGTELAKHNRPNGCENLTQISGISKTTVFEDETTLDRIIDLAPGDVLPMTKGQWHIHANDTKNDSITFFKLVGDITDIMDTVRNTMKKIDVMEK